MAVPQWRRASREPPRIGALLKDDGERQDATPVTVVRSTGREDRGKEAWSDNFRGNTSISVRRARGPSFCGPACALSGCGCACAPVLGASAFMSLSLSAHYNRVPMPVVAAQGLSAQSPRIPTHATAASHGTPGCNTIKHAAGRRHGSRSGVARSGVVAPATRPNPIRTASEMSHGRVPGSEPRRLRIVRAGDWRSRKRPEPALPCDCDLRFSFP